MAKETQASLDLSGQCLIAMPGMLDSRFENAVIYISSHRPSGAMGIVINRQLSEPGFLDVLRELKLDGDFLAPELLEEIPVFEGGPVEQGRGFVLHTTDYSHPTTLASAAGYGVTTTLDVLRNIAEGLPPSRYLFALGYAGWTGGQLEREIAENSWLTCPATDELLFQCDPAARHSAALNSLGVDPSLLSGNAGHA